MVFQNLGRGRAFTFLLSAVSIIYHHNHAALQTPRELSALNNQQFLLFLGLRVSWALLVPAGPTHATVVRCRLGEQLCGPCLGSHTLGLLASDSLSWERWTFLCVV